MRPAKGRMPRKLKKQIIKAFQRIAYQGLIEGQIKLVPYGKHGCQLQYYNRLTTKRQFVAGAELRFKVLTFIAV